VAGIPRAEAAEMSIAEYLTADPRLEHFHAVAAATNSPGLRKTWLEAWDTEGNEMGDHRQGVTVFVPMDAAFERLDPEMRVALVGAQLDNELRYTFLGHHYVHRLYPLVDFESGSQRTFRGGGSVELGMDPLTWAGCPIVETDIRLANGYIHLLDGVVVPADVLEAVGD
jgi:hypothetical protein